MKIVSWNCNKIFREKYKDIAEENADIYVICECENPVKHEGTDYSEFPVPTSFGQEICIIWV